MIKSIKVTNAIGESLLIELRNPITSGFFVRDIDGLGAAKATINLSESLSADGGFFNSSRLLPRNIVLDLGFYNNGLESVETIRQKTYRFFPAKRDISLEIETDARVGVTTGFVESNTPNIFSNDSGTVISVVCPSSFFYSKDEITTIFGGVESLFSFPWENPSLTVPLIEFGSIFTETAKTIVYTGDEETGLELFARMLGPVTNLGIHNLNTGQSMILSSSIIASLTGSGLVANDFVVISTIRGTKFIYLVRNGILYNILNAVSQPANWFRLQRGNNTFAYTADSGLSNIQFYTQHRIVYGGL